MAKKNNNNKTNNTRLSNTPKFDLKGKAKQPENKVNDGVFVYTGSISVRELAEKLGQNPSDIIKYLFLNKKMMITINSTLDDEIIGELCLNYGYDFKKEKIVEAENFEEIEIVDDEKSLEERPPVVVVMGHVDHGKTTLIDSIRKSNIAAGEAGKITQAIGAYQKEIDGKKITFLDTPGHEAFTQMRLRGAKMTDIAIIVVAADDGVMPQTKEAIDHAKAAGVTIIVAINKIDKPSANTQRVLEQLMAEGLVPEEYGGDIIVKEISAKQKIGIDELLEIVLLVAEMKELKANPNRYALGSVVEAELDKAEGARATLLVQNGTLKQGDCLVIGNSFCRVRKMVNEYHKVLKSAGPSTPVVVTGISEVPQAGDRFMAYPDEKTAKEIAARRALHAKENQFRQNNNVTLEDLSNQFKEGEVKNVNIILKADSQGSVEAVKSSLLKLNNDEVKINIVRAAPGQITQSDVLLAEASGAIIYGFNVRPDSIVRQKAKEEKIEIRLHAVIYALIEEIEQAMKGMLKPIEQEVVIGQAEIRSIFKASKVGNIAGAYVTEGYLTKGASVRLIRNGIVIADKKLGSLKRFKDDVNKVTAGFECGFTIEGYNDIDVGDIVEAYEIQQIARE